MGDTAPDTPGAPGPLPDGRRRRAQASQQAIIAAALALVRETGESPSPDAVAKRAGVSRRTLFRLFGDLDTLHMEIVAFQRAEVVKRFPPPLDLTLPVPKRVEALVRHRADVYEYILPLREVAERRAHGQPIVQQSMRQARQQWRDHTALMLSGAFDGLPPQRRRDRLDEAELLLSIQAWRTLRKEQGRSKAAATRIVLGALHRLVMATS